jgi:ABC-type antimicrobial peptide transport system permease subunit
MRSLIEANMGIAVRSHLAQRDLLHSIEAAVSTVNAEVPVFETKTLESMVSDSDSLRNFDLLLMGGFSFLALALAALGVYAVMAYSVSQRTREIGIRIALGARSRDVLRLILRQGARLAIAGSVIGVVGAFLLRKIMASVLYGLSANDPHSRRSEDIPCYGLRESEELHTLPQLGPAPTSSRQVQERSNSQAPAAVHLFCVPARGSANVGGGSC